MHIDEAIVKLAAKAALSDPWETYSEDDQRHHLNVARTVLGTGADRLLIVTLRHAASQMKDAEDAAWLDSWADEICEGDSNRMSGTVASSGTMNITSEQHEADVRKAKAEAWDECGLFLATHVSPQLIQVYDDNPYAENDDRGGARR